MKKPPDAKSSGPIASLCPKRSFWRPTPPWSVLCSGADFATEEVEKLLPRNTCALIKSSFGFKIGKVCPYLESADMIVGENTCDGKKKAYESLTGLVDNLYVMDLPQVKSENGKALLKSEYKRFKAASRNLPASRSPPNR
jgi:benzoyl-CoA reductase/2-hydroxyglutaryl-CoA dehydratase subunit BcrC/BadD/HgdB